VGVRAFRGWAIVAAVAAACAVGVGWLLRGGEPEGADGERIARSAPTSDHEAPRLAGRPDAAPAETANPTAVLPRPSDAAKAPTATRKVRLHFEDARGWPVANASVAIVVHGGGPESAVSAGTDGHGDAEVEAPEGRWDSLVLSVSAPGGLGTVVVFSKTDAGGIDPRDLERVVLDSASYLVVRTVDSSGRPRPDERIVYRVIRDGVVASGYSGDTSAADATCRLGPFPNGTEVDLQAGARGRSYEEVLAAPWQRVRVDAGLVDLVVGEPPRLRLRIRGLAAGQVPRVSALDPATGSSLFGSGDRFVPPDRWESPSLAQTGPAEVVVGPLDDGRFARRQVVPSGEEIDIDLEAGLPMTGIVVSSDLKGTLRGTVTASGRGFWVTAPLDEEGRFRFPGLPDEDLSFEGRVRTEDGAICHGQVRRSRGATVIEIPVARTFTVRGEAILEGTASPGERGMLTVTATRTEDGRTLSTTSIGGLGFTLELAPGTWRLSANLLGGTRLYFGEKDLGDVSADRNDVVIPMVSGRPRKAMSAAR
jgi:hypothetical protein